MRDFVCKAPLTDPSGWVWISHDPMRKKPFKLDSHRWDLGLSGKTTMPREYTTLNGAKAGSAVLLGYEPEWQQCQPRFIPTDLGDDTVLVSSSFESK
ncbi:hypothetical protein D3C87_466370 [compost metagenome]